MSRYLMVFLIIMGGLIGCAPQPRDIRITKQELVIYPDYKGVAIPFNIAPLNFMLRDDCVDAVCVRIKGKKQQMEVSDRGKNVIFPLYEWHEFLRAEAGQTLTVTVIARKNGMWVQYPCFQWTVVREPLDSYITYRLIEPGYEVWNQLQLVERCVENFNERVLADNSQLNHKCMNCHIHGQGKGSLSFFHLRGKGGGTILNRNGKLRKLNLKTEAMEAGAVYGDFHPSGRYGVFSTNVIIPAFHSINSRRLEVYDEFSDLLIADFDHNRLIGSPVISRKDKLETFPTFSADGKSVYFCSAPASVLSDGIDHIRYSLCRISFDAKAGKWGNRVDTLWNARLNGGSVCFPKASPDGRFILYTVADYGTFPIWHRETDLQLMELRTKKINKLACVNSNRSDTYHCWSSTGRWIAFASKRGDGQYGRVYFAYVDKTGRVYTPFVLPQSNPEKDDLNLKSYNIPDLSVNPVPFSSEDVIRLNSFDVPSEPFKCVESVIGNKK